MRKVVLIPWRPTANDRILAFDRLWRQQWEPMNVPIYLGDSGHATFHRGASRNAAAYAAGDWDVAMFVDADVRLPERNIMQALDTASRHLRVVFPHDRYRALDRHDRTFRESTAPTNGGAFAISRTAWDLVQGFDERFAGWGFEDAAFRCATETILGAPVRLVGTMSELHHVKTGRGKSDTERTLFERYKRLWREGDRDAMLALVNEDPLR